ncbi:MAG: hypothetical protein ACREBS_00840 [Nitrososphaerales archaeon]
MTDPQSRKVHPKLIGDGDMLQKNYIVSKRAACVIDGTSGTRWPWRLMASAQARPAAIAPLKQYAMQRLRSKKIRGQATTDQLGDG